VPHYEETIENLSNNYELTENAANFIENMINGMSNTTNETEYA